MLLLPLLLLLQTERETERERDRERKRQIRKERPGERPVERMGKREKETDAERTRERYRDTKGERERERFQSDFMFLRLFGSGTRSESISFNEIRSTKENLQNMDPFAKNQKDTFLANLGAPFLPGTKITVGCCTYSRRACDNCGVIDWAELWLAKQNLYCLGQNTATGKKHASRFCLIFEKTQNCK